MKKNTALWIAAGILIAILAATSTISIMIAIRQARELQTVNIALSIAGAADKAKKDTAHEIEKASPASIVDSSPNAQDLIRARDASVNGFNDSLRARAREILQR